LIGPGSESGNFEKAVPADSEPVKKTVLAFKTGYGYGGWGSFGAVIMNSSKFSKLLKI